MLEDKMVEFLLPRKLAISPNLIGAVRNLPGVAEVVEL